MLYLGQFALQYPHIQTEQQLCMLYVYATPIQIIILRVF